MGVFEEGGKGKSWGAFPSLIFFCLPPPPLPSDLGHDTSLKRERAEEGHGRKEGYRVHHRAVEGDRSQDAK